MKENFILLGVIVLFTGCALKKCDFSASEAVPEDKVMVYIYRPYSLHGGIYSFGTFVNGYYCGKINTGQFIRRVLDPGEVHIKTLSEHDYEYRLQATESGKKYYLECNAVDGKLISNLEIKQVSKFVAFLKVLPCRLLYSD